MNETFQRLKTKINSHIHKIVQNNIKLDGVFFCTEDGFNISHYTAPNVNIEEDKMAAIISTIYGISGACATEIKNTQVKSIMIEYDKSILLIINFSFENSRYVMAMLSNKNNNLGQVLFLGNSFIKLI